MSRSNTDGNQVEQVKGRGIPHIHILSPYFPWTGMCTHTKAAAQPPAPPEREAARQRNETRAADDVQVGADVPAWAFV